MSHWIWLAFLVLSTAAVLARVWSWLTAPTPFALDSSAVVQDAFATVLARGANGARVRFQAKRSADVRIDFVKRITAEKGIRLSAVIERTPAMLPAIARIELVLANRAATSAVSRHPRSGQELEIDLGKDTILAEAVARAGFEDGLALQLAGDVFGLYDLVLVRNVPRLTGVGSS